MFYCWGEVRFFPVMLALILINYLCGLGLERFEQNKTARLILLLIALAGSLGMLFYFKYANFVLSSINAIFGIGFAPIQGISVLPLGPSSSPAPSSSTGMSPTVSMSTKAAMSSSRSRTA